MTATLAPPPAPAAGPTRAPRGPRRWAALLLLGGALPFVLVALARATRFAEGDTYWQVATGAEILQRGTTSLVEDDSWTAAGTPWHPNSWLYDVLVERAWALGGWAGLGWWTVLTVSAVGLAVALVGRGLGASAPVLTVASTVAAVPLVVWLSARPQTVSYALVVLVVGLAGRVLAARRPTRVAAGALALVALTALWVNLHLAALSGLAAVGAGAGLALLAGPGRALLRDRSAWPAAAAALARAAAVVAAVGLGCLLSPLGTGILSAAGHTAGASVEIIDEWAPLWRAKSYLVLTWVVALVFLLVLVAAWRRGARAGAVPAWLPYWVGATAALVVGGLGAARFSPMALLVAVPAVAAVVPLLRPARLPWLASRLALALPVAVGVAVLTVAVTDLPDFGRPGSLFPTAATVAAVPDGCRVLNEYDEGGLLTLLRGGDGVLVSADGRNDVYGTATLRWTETLMRGHDGALAALAERGVGCLLLRPDRPLVAQAVAAGWQVTARDDARVLLVAP
ncbi:hypothetical protein [Klenkia brasiliensis]|uniref:Dolichyl-phosphate-mannose-protein mannosyltransferase n=1 Tax=Klenkia brasiliensis TaxID=333142 RepID=A0A1G7YK77_9ACTN|nr:hypothetical protein [Klenkia brasiliensis]SDG96715.1 hypothetical protein SAMN05660324_3990 [Klenkia brasiliensis]